MKALIPFALFIDKLNDRVGRFAEWAIFLSCFVSAGNALIRYGFSIGSNAWLEVQWYMFGAAVMFGASQVLRLNEHVRVDLMYARYSTRVKVYVDLFGTLFFLVPVCVAMIYYSGPLFISKFVSGEVSQSAGGLVRWPIFLTMPVGFALILLQGISEMIKRAAWLRNEYDMDTHYERPLQ
ncbi:TRAP transporter small permease subunit [Ideonella margarita]|uniref:TRAP transporter small permease protein n=1 Tax=Ideonella margarita TaxID=2984191 RepID=A0ABU9C253_9BURK